MYFVGLDLAWSTANQTGIAVLDDEGRLLRICAAVADDEIIESVEPYARTDCLVAIDAPLIVTNPNGFRHAETLLNRDFSPFEATAQPANTGNRLFDPPRGAVLANALGLDMDPWSTSTRRAIEVYPHPATVSLFNLGRTLKYKRRIKDPVKRKSELMKLVGHIEDIEARDPALRLGGHPDWSGLRAKTDAATRPFQLNGCEDPIDAVLCAYIALYAERRPGDVEVYGDFATGYIVTPRLPEGLQPTRRSASPPQAPAPLNSTGAVRADSNGSELLTRLARAEAQLADLQRELAEIRNRLDP